jgi:osmotically-inducible protein OsmY
VAESKGKGEEDPMKNDRELREIVLSELALEPGIDIAEVQVEVRDGIVVLTGYVPSLTEIHFAESCVMRVPGVRAVVNELSTAVARP